VGWLAIEIFGYKDAEGAREYARLFGHAFQLTNILRDVEGDLSQGRLYLPLEDLRRFGLTETQLRAGGPAFVELMRFECARDRALYASARSALSPVDRRAMRPAEVMAAVYEAVLGEIEKRPERVLAGKLQLPRWRKLTAALSGWFKSPTRSPIHA
jgi:phytoene synthase